MVAEHVGIERIGLAPRRQHRGDALAQGLGIAAVEVEQQRPLQGQDVARLGPQQRAPGVGGALPVAALDPAQGGEVAALALVRAGGERLGGVEQRRFASATSEGSVRLSRKPAFITRGSSHAGSAAIAASRSSSGVP